MKNYVIIILCCISFNGFAQVRNSYPAIPLKKIVDSLKIDSNAIQIKITKSTYLLQVIANGKVLKTYPCVFGFGYPEDKFQKGDGTTPEGKFLVWAFYPDASWGMFVSLNFPNAASLKKIAEAKKNKFIPQNAKTGGSIGIHGTNQGCESSIDTKNNWTYGCISVKTADIKDICKVLKRYGNVVEIVK